MPEIHNISGLARVRRFPSWIFFEHYKRSFENRELGRVKKLLPLREMAMTVLGRYPYFSPEGEDCIGVSDDVHPVECPEAV